MIKIDKPMPSCCYECFACDESGDYPYCTISQDSRGYNFPTREQRMPTCPLREIKTNDDYMKLIVGLARILGFFDQGYITTKDSFYERNRTTIINTINALSELISSEKDSNV